MSAPRGRGVKDVRLKLLARHDLASPGLDGTVRPRGQNGDVAILGDTVFVGGGALFHGARSTPGRICTDYGGVKVVDLSRPAQPRLETTITIEDTQGVIAGPAGNSRRGRLLNNVSVSVAGIDARSFDTSAFTGDVLALASQRCEPPYFAGARIEFWNVTNPASPQRLGVFDPAALTERNTGRTGEWGIFEDVRMFTRADRPGKVYAVATTPFSIGNATDASPFGDFRLLDVTDPSRPVQISTFPSVSVGQSTNNGCRTFQAGHSVAPTPNGKHAILSWYDGIQPRRSPIEPTGLGGSHSAAVLKLDLDDLPQHSSGDPKTFSPKPKSWGYPPARDGGGTSAGRVEGNAADVEPFTGPNGHLLTFVSEDDVDPALTSLRITSPVAAAYKGRACEALFARKLYQRPGKKLSRDVAYVGRGCPASELDNTTNLAPDEYLEDPKGKLALLEPGGNRFDGCSFTEKIKRAAAAGAAAVMSPLEGDFLNIIVPGPEGGIPSIPPVGIQLTAFNRMVGDYVPDRVLTGTTFPSSWTRTSSGHVRVRPFAFAVRAATDEKPIEISTSTSNPGPALAHGLNSGDHVAVAGVEGNTAANGNWKITVTSPTTFELNGSDGNAPYSGGGYVVVCARGQPACPATPSRTDASRFKSTADAEDRTAAAELAPAERFDIIPGQRYEAGAFLEVESVTGGAFQAAVVWYGPLGAHLGQTQIARVTEVTSRRRYERTVSAPVGAVEGAVRFEWTGEDARGTAYADGFEVVPHRLEASLQDRRGHWGAQKIIDFSRDKPKAVASYRSPRARKWPPPNGGIYAPRLARMVGNDLAFTTWMSDGLRVLDVRRPGSPREIAAFVPRGVPDPSRRAGAGITNKAGENGSLLRGRSWPSHPLLSGVDVVAWGPRRSSGLVVVSDINAGLYVLMFKTR